MPSITRPPVPGSPTVRTDNTTTTEGTAVTPAAAQPKQGWVAKLGDKAKTAVKNTLGNGISATPTLKVPLVDIGVWAHGETQFAFPNTPAFTQLVKGDSIREKYAASTGKTYVRMEGELGAMADLPLGAIHVGLTREVDASFVNAYKLDSAKNVLRSTGGMAKDAFATVVLPKDAKHLRKQEWAPGAEMVLRSRSENHKGSELPVASLGPVAVLAGVMKSNEVRNTRTIKHLGDDVYYTQIGQLTTKHLDKTTSVVPGGLGGAVGLVSGMIAKGTVGHDTITTHEVLAAGVFDLKGDDAKKFDAIHTMPAERAAAALRTSDNAVAVATIDGKATDVHGGVKVLGMNLVDTHNVSGFTQATVFNPDVGTTKLEEASTSAPRSGLIYRLMNEGQMPKAFLDGIERKVDVALGTVQRPDGSTTRAMQLNLDITDHKFLREEAQEWSRFASAMGSELPIPDKKKYGKSNIKVGVAFDDDQVKALLAAAKKDPMAATLAIAGAQSKIDGRGLPPWVADPQGFEARIAAYEATRQDETDPRTEGRKAYYFDAPGRDLDADISSYRTAKLVSKALAQMKPDATARDFKDLLNAVGEQYSRDVRTTALAFKNMAGGTLTQLDVHAKDVDAKLTGNVAPVKQDRLRVEVGKLLDPAALEAAAAPAPTPAPLPAPAATVATEPAPAVVPANAGRIEE